MNSLFSFSTSVETTAPRLQHPHAVISTEAVTVHLKFSLDPCRQKEFMLLHRRRFYRWTRHRNPISYTPVFSRFGTIRRTVTHSIHASNFWDNGVVRVGAELDLVPSKHSLVRAVVVVRVAVHAFEVTVVRTAFTSIHVLAVIPVAVLGIAFVSTSAILV